ncbi:phosphoenolpyruvate--protein phosphotransferase [Pseudomonas sp. TTU2014-080ASC]|uniref:phosphoenolpyruvate--protein phosphotransferase n=1 Tax=Pseudomonas sp. TTU2014-080ASC TaxID=1729724 RepID=UPI00071898C1|nr:phosphoenolpyruvate--protein phosphotransferase [Pseudomonas sp. TTU2014-080ASC]KRW59302.1 PTS N-acetyl-D-glucosamine transporter [Pseudomonas sp. TTU2014-080ASC]
MNNKNLALKAPLSGPLVPLNRVPDPVFSSNSLGEGIAIDPTNDCLHAPCAGVITHVARSRHAIGMRTEQGIEILMHVGLETVLLKGQGFDVLVSEGDQVRESQPLMHFDMDRIALSCKSLITVMVLNGTEGYQIRPLTTQPVKIGAPLLLLSRKDEDSSSSSPEESIENSLTASGTALVAHKGGLHARPAALIRQTAADFSSVIELQISERTAKTDSIVGIMGLGIAEGDEVLIICRGEDCQQALQALQSVISTPSGDHVAEPINAAVPPRPSRPARPNTLEGVTASPGQVSGPLMRVDDIALPVQNGREDPREQHLALDFALQQVRNDIQANLNLNHEFDNPDETAIFTAHYALLEDPALLDAADLLIDEGVDAAHAWDRAIEMQRSILKSLDNRLLSERANDLLDLKKRVLRVLLSDTATLDLAPGSIVAAHEITPSDLGPMVDARIAGICMAEGGATSHVAILARGKGIPCLVALGPELLQQESGQIVVLNADEGLLELKPTAERLQQIAEAEQQNQLVRQRQQNEAHREALTQDGRHIEVAANVGSSHEAEEALKRGADGIGLLRTEFLFIDRKDAPDESEQLAAYQAVLEAIGKRKVIIRTIDVGGDKHLSYLPLPAEENPALGLRGIRLGQARPALLDQQLRALLKVESEHRLRIMLPMVSEVDELISIRQRLIRLADELGIKQLPELGVMIEVPSAALLADQLAQHADFFSIGTNDLSQYTLAMDRGHPGLAQRIDAMHPALLRLISKTCAAASRHGRWVGVCGALASDPLATPVLIGLGVEELSVGPNLIPEIKERVRQLNAADCRQRSHELLNLSSARAIREKCREFWPLA